MAAGRPIDVDLDRGGVLDGHALDVVRDEHPRHVRVHAPSGATEFGEIVETLLEWDPDLRSVTLVLDGGTRPARKSAPLTRRECEVVELAGHGFTNAQISRLLWVTPDTVKFHLRNASRKLGVHGRAEAARVAQARGLIGRRTS